MSRNGYTVLMSARVIVEALAVAGILWLARSVTQQNVAIAKLQIQVSALMDVPKIAQQQAVDHTEMADLERRVDRLEAQRN